MQTPSHEVFSDIFLSRWFRAVQKCYLKEMFNIAIEQKYTFVPT